MLLTVTALLGCRGPAALAPNPFEIDAREYDRVYDASVQVLRDYGFTVDRQDYRFGRVTTGPLGSPTLLEPWKRDNSTLGQAAASTVGDLQRKVTVFIDPVIAMDATPARAAGEEVAEDAEIAASAGASASPADGGEAGAYLLRVEVLIERREVPTRRLTGTASRNVFSSLRDTPVEWQKRGIEANYWLPVSRDPQLEQRLLREIVSRSLSLPPREQGSSDQRG